MKIHTAEKPDAAKVKRMLKAWDYGVEVEDMEDRFGLCRTDIYRLLKQHGRTVAMPAVSRKATGPAKPRTGRWSMA